jgi:DNA-binding SARP family transcriptional activator
MTSGKDPGGALRFAVLGPVRAWRGTEPISVGSPQQKALLCALLLRGGRPATAQELLNAVWGEEPPPTALAALRSYAFRLRKALGAEALATVEGGYVLDPGEGFDLFLAERHQAAAEKARAAGDLATARDELRGALALFDGEPLAGLPGPYAETQRTRLTEWRLQLTETCLDLDLQAGCHAEAVSELTVLSAEHPLRERPRALLMLALYRSGRQAEALGVYADTRRLLADELGVDPGAELAELHQRVLEADPSLLPLVPRPGAGAATGSGAVAAEPVRPAQLPATVADFTGREDFVRELGERLAGASAEGGVMAVSAVAGIGGVGKTTLAVHVAHAVAGAFPDGQLYVDLQGADAVPAEPETVLASFLRSLGVTDSAIPESLADRAALYRSTLAGRRVLALLDNAHDAAQVRHLLPGTPGCAALITSRPRMVDLAGAHLVDLDVMSPEEALLLFTRIVGEERVAGERQAALEVVAACGFLPLAIRIAASRLATRRSWTVSFLARRLSDERRRLDELRAGDLAVRATFDFSYGQLTPSQARAFRLLALADGPDISLDAAAAVLDLDVTDAEELLEALVDISLLESNAPARYRYHDLVRLYARDCARRHEGDHVRCAALSRLLDFYLASAACAYELENPGDRLLAHLAPVGRPGLAFDSRAEGLEWLFTEASCLLAAVRQAAGDGCEAPLRRAVDLLFTTQDLMESGIHARQYEQATRALAATACTCGEQRVEARTRVLLGQLLGLSGHFEEADGQAQRALVLGRSVEDPLTCSYAPIVRGMIAAYGRRFEDAAGHYQSGLDAFRADGNRHGEAAALSNLSRVRNDLGDIPAAVAAAEDALSIYRGLRAGFRLGNGLYALAIALTAARREDEAYACLTEALPIFRAARQQLWEGMTLFRMAEVQLASGGHRQAASLAEQSLNLLRETGGAWRRAHALTVLGTSLDGMGQPDRARACWRDALAEFTALGSPEADTVRRLLTDPAAPAVAV